MERAAKYPKSTFCKLIAGTNTRQLRARGDSLLTELLSTPSTTERIRRRFNEEGLEKNCRLFAQATVYEKSRDISFLVLTLLPPRDCTIGYGSLMVTGE